MRPAIVWAALSVSACASDLAFLSSEGLSTLVLVARSGSAVSATVYALDPASPLTMNAPDADELVAVGYVDPPLGLAAGPIGLADVGAPLPSGDRHHALVGDAWAALAGAPPLVSNLRVAASSGCARLAIATSAFPERPQMAVALDRERVLVSSEGGRLYEVTRTETRELTSLSTSTPRIAGVSRAGEVFLVGQNGSFSRGDPTRALTLGPPLAGPVNRTARLDASQPGAPLELYLVDDSLTVQRFDGERWSVIRAGTPKPGETREGIAWLAPGLAVLIGAETNGLIELTSAGEERRVTLNLMTFPRVDGLWTAKHVVGQGVVVGSFFAVQLARRGEAWQPLAATPSATRTEVIVDLGGGRFLAGGQNGVFVQWSAIDGGVCPEIFDIGQREAFVAAPLDDGFMIVSGGIVEGYHLSVGAPRR